MSRTSQFDNSGTYLLVANQDSDSLAVFSFNIATGDLLFTGNQCVFDAHGMPVLKHA